MSDNALTIVYRPLGDLKPHPQNPRQHPATQRAQIAESIERYGWTNPIIVDEDNTILAGHGRFEVAQGMELDEVPTVTIAGLTDEQKRAYILTDNKVAENAHWDADAVLREIEFLTGHGIEPEHMGFDEEDLIGLGSLCDDVDFPDEPGVTIESETEPTILQGDGVPAYADERLDEPRDKEDHTNEPAGTEESEVDFDTPPSGKVLLNVPIMSFQRDRIMEVLEMVKEEEEVDTDTDALVILAELYAEAREYGEG